MARIRAVMLVAKTHHDCCGGLDDTNKTLAVMDAITAGLAGRGLIATSHLPKQRGIQSPLKMLRQYSSTVHGCNLVLHRFNGTVQEKSAFLREYQKILRPHRSCCPQDFVVMVGRRGLLGQLGVEINLGGWPKTVPKKRG